jgi:Carboxypeptidase regulatory-like domain/TonB dependent receptor
MSQGSNTLRSTVHKVFAFAVVLCLGLMLISNAHAQVLYGSLTGTVTDPTGAVIPNTSLVLTNQGTAEARTVVTNAQGEYSALNLAPGTYMVTAARNGNFAGFTQKNVAINANQQVRVDIALQPSSVSTEVTVNTAPPLLQTETAEVNHSISQTQVAELPLTSTQGRNFQALYTLVPGAAAVSEQNSTASNPSRAISANINGTGYNGNTTRIDGAVNTYGWLPYIIAYVPPADSIQSVNLVTNAFNAEQGMAGGASINVTIKTGTNQFHGSLWEYNQLFNANARPYVSTVQAVPQVPKNIFNQFGFSIGGPVYIPKILTGKKKLFFFQGFERTTRRQLITGQQTVPTTDMLGGNFNAVTSTTVLYDPQPGGVGPYLPVGSRPTFMSEYPATGNAIPASRQSKAASTMLALLQPISSTIPTPSASALAGGLINDYNGSGTLSYNRNTSDSKVTYNPTDMTSIFGRYSVEPFAVTDPQELGAAGGGTFDGGQPGAAAGRIQNVGLGVSHIITSNLVVDADFGYTRQVAGAQSLVDIAAGDYGLNTLGIPGTNGIGNNYVGQPAFAFCNTGSTNNNCFSSLGNSNGANPFLFRDNQFTTDVNVSWNKSKHAMKYGFTYYHFDLNHFQPTSGSDINTPRGGFRFQGGLTSNSTSGLTDYNALADFLLGLPNNGTGLAVAKAVQLTNPNSLRWTQLAGYAQDQWILTPKLTVNYGVRYEYYPAPTRDHTGVYRLDPTLPQSGNVVIGGVGGNPENAGFDMGYGSFVPRLGLAYRVNDKMVIRTGAGITTDPDSLRFLRDAYPEDLAPNYSGTATATIAVDPTQGNLPLPLTVGIPTQATPNLSSGFVALPIGSTTNTAPAHYRRGYIDSWNLFVEQDLGNQFIANIGYVGTHVVRSSTGLHLNAAPLPNTSTTCMANGQYSPGSGLTGTCNFAANELINQQHCNATTGYTCYNTGGITMNEPLFSAGYNALQSQLSRNAGRLAQFGVVYTWSHAINYADNGAGSGSTGPSFNYPGYFKLNRATATYDRTNNLQVWSIYHLPFGRGQTFANHGIASAILGGFQLNGQVSHVSGAPFSVSPTSSTINSNGNTQYADLVKPYRQLSGHNRTPGNTSIDGGNPWFDPTSFANPTANPDGTPRFGTTHRNEFRGPGVTDVNASIFRGFHIFRESEFQVRVEAFNLLNHPQLIANPNATVPSAASAASSTFGYITNFTSTNNANLTRTLQFSGRINF